MSEIVRLHDRRPVVGAHAEHRRRDYSFARDQREAGIEDFEWEDRLPPMHPWVFWLAVAGSWVLFGAAFSLLAYLF